MKNGETKDVVDELDLMSETQHQDAVRRNDETGESKLRQFRAKVSDIVGRKK